MNYSYKNNFLVAEITETDMPVTYQLEMILNNEIFFLLPPKQQTKDNTTYLHYDITSKISLKQLTLFKKLTLEQFINLCLSIIKMIYELEAYQLNFSNILFNPEYIYINTADYSPSFIYMPINSPSINIKDIQQFMQSLLISNYVDLFSDMPISKLIYILNSDISDFAFFEKQLSDILTNPLLNNPLPECKTDSQEINTKIIPYKSIPAISSKNIICLCEALIISVVLSGGFIYLKLFKEMPILYLPIFLGFFAIFTFIFIKINHENILKKEPDLCFEPVVTPPLPEPIPIKEVYNDRTEIIRLRKEPHLKNSEGNLLYINKSFFRLGKNSDLCDCAINNPRVSKIHADILLKADKAFLIDLNSKNGSFINSEHERIQPNQEYELKNGDVIYLADEKFRLFL